MNDSLAQRLHEQGILCRLEARERLALLIPNEAGAIAMNGDSRARLLHLFRAEGFTHVALELDPDGATLPRP